MLTSQELYALAKKDYPIILGPVDDEGKQSVAIEGDWNAYTAVIHLLEDLREFQRAWLTENRRDDSLELDINWAVGVAQFVNRDLGVYCLLDQMELESGCVRIDLCFGTTAVSTTPIWYLATCDGYLRTVKTRGDVRKFCNAAKIRLREREE
jgi:hypothetical protein